MKREGTIKPCQQRPQGPGWSVMGLAKRIGISQPVVSYAIQRGQRVVREKGLQSVPE
jgi:hypothetical protein